MTSGCTAAGHLINAGAYIHTERRSKLASEPRCCRLKTRYKEIGNANASKATLAGRNCRLAGLRNKGPRSHFKPNIMPVSTWEKRQIYQQFF